MHHNSEPKKRGSTADQRLAKTDLAYWRAKLKKPVRAAYLYITAHGLYEAQLNGERVGNDYFILGFTWSIARSK